MTGSSSKARARAPAILGTSSLVSFRTSEPSIAGRTGSDALSKSWSSRVIAADTNARAESRPANRRGELPVATTPDSLRRDRQDEVRLPPLDRHGGARGPRGRGRLSLGGRADRQRTALPRARLA